MGQDLCSHSVLCWCSQQYFRYCNIFWTIVALLAAQLFWEQELLQLWVCLSCPRSLLPVAPYVVSARCVPQFGAWPMQWIFCCLQWAGSTSSDLLASCFGSSKIICQWSKLVIKKTKPNQTHCLDLPIKFGLLFPNPHWNVDHWFSPRCTMSSIRPESPSTSAHKLVWCA